MESGARPSEIVNLTAAQIVLDGPIPFIRIRAEGRVLKTEHSERDIPLVGWLWTPCVGILTASRATSTRGRACRQR